MSLIDTLKALAVTVRNEKKKEANSAVRIGDLFIAIIDFIKSVQSGEIRQDGVDTYNDTTEGKSSLLNKYPNPELYWTVLVRHDETNESKASLYKWNGSKWINLESSVYVDGLAPLFNNDGDSVVYGDVKRISDENNLLIQKDSKGRVLSRISSDGTIIPTKLRLTGKNIQEIKELIVTAITDSYLTTLSSLFTIEQDENNLYKIVDKQGRMLARFSNDGTLIPAKLRLTNKNIAEIKELIATAITDSFLTTLSDLFTVEQDGNNLYKIVDKKGRLLARFSNDGTLIPAKLRLTKANLKYIDNTILTAIENSYLSTLSKILITYDDKDSLYVLKDSKGRCLAKITLDGTIVPTKFQFTKANIQEVKDLITQGIKDSVIGSQLVDNKNIYQLPFPYHAATINIKGAKFPSNSTDKIPVTFQYADNMGNRFEDSGIIKIQGNSSTASERPSIAIDFDNIKVRFGTMPLQDSFHIKSYVWDKFRGISVWAYDFANEVRDTLPMDIRYPNNDLKQGVDPIKGTTKNLLNEVSSGANFHSRGFPVRVYLNGEFKGMYCLIYKKDRANYEHDKSNPLHIHLDGELSVSSFWGGTPDWTKFEVRTPKGLKDIDGNDYDSDNPKELSDTHPLSKAVKDKIIRFSGAIAAINANPTKETFEQYFLPTPMKDYVIRSNALYNNDGFAKNWQWLTWDGDKITISDHDWDSLLGMYYLGNFVTSNSTSVILGTDLNTPTGQLLRLYKPEIDARYKELRDLGIISVDYIVNSIRKWTERVGYDNYKEDFALYPNTPSNRESGINSEYWEHTGVSYSPANYSSTKAYAVGDVAIWGVAVKYTFKCVKAHTNQPPTTKLYPVVPEQLGYFESLQRVESWLKQRLISVDGYFNYSKS